jgi:hypothetical protein
MLCSLRTKYPEIFQSVRGLPQGIASYMLSLLITSYGGWDNVDVTTTRYGLDGQWIEVCLGMRFSVPVQAAPKAQALYIRLSCLPA